MYKAKQRIFLKLVIAGLKELGMTDGEDFLSYKYAIETPLGKLYISIHDDDLDSSIYSVFTKFAEVEKAKGKLYDLNEYSGKWNFHYFVKDHKPEEIAEHIILQIKNVMSMRKV